MTNSPVLLFALDRDGVVTLAEGKDPAALGLTPDEIVGQSVFDLFVMAPALLVPVQRALESRRNNVGGSILPAIAVVGTAGVRV